MPPPSDPLPLRVNRAPVLTLWAAVVAERSGHPEETALTLGAAVAGTAACAKARRLGIAEDRPEEDGQRRRGGDAGGERRAVVRLLGREIPVSRSDGGPLLAAHEERPQSPASVKAYLSRAFGDRLGEVRAAMEALAAPLPPDELNRVGFRLYERFRPEVPEGVEGWGAKAVLHVERIRTAAG